MPGITIPSGQFAKVRLAGKGWDGFSNVPTALKPGASSVTVDIPSLAYVADLGPAANGIGRLIAVVPKTPPPVGGFYIILLTCVASDAVGLTPLAPMHLEIQMNGAVPPPPAATDLEMWDNLSSGAHENTVAGFAAIGTAPADPATNPLTF